MTYILAASKIWHPNISENLSKRTLKKFFTVKSPHELTFDYIKTINPEYIFFPHWSYTIPSEIYQNFECVIFHMTDLPYGRGGSPLQNLIANGIYQTKISALRCEAEIDSGPIYIKKPLLLEGKAQDIYQQANLIIEEMIVEIIQKKLVPIPQEGEIVSFSRRTKEQSNIAHLHELNKIYDYIRMLDAEHYPKAFIETEHLRLEFNDANLHGTEISAKVTIQLKRKNHDASNRSDSSSSR